MWEEKRDKGEILGSATIHETPCNVNASSDQLRRFLCIINSKAITIREVRPKDRKRLPYIGIIFTVVVELSNMHGE
jgi:hypothetical protein